MFMLNKTAITNWRLHFTLGYCALLAWRPIHLLVWRKRNLVLEQIQARVRLRLCAFLLFTSWRVIHQFAIKGFFCFTFIENKEGLPVLLFSKTVRTLRSVREFFLFYLD